MWHIAVSFLWLVTTFAASSLQSKHYQEYKLRDVDLPAKAHGGYYVEVLDGHKRTVVEEPHTVGVPTDQGGNFGDMEFRFTAKTGILIARDTIVNQNTEEESLIRTTAHLMATTSRI